MGIFEAFKMFFEHDTQQIKWDNNNFGLIALLQNQSPVFFGKRNSPSQWSLVTREQHIFSQDREKFEIRKLTEVGRK